MVLEVPDPKNYCSCNNCQKMETVEASFCYQSTRFIKVLTKNRKWLKSKHMKFSLYLFTERCLLDHPYVDYLLHPVSLEVNLRTQWIYSIPESKDMANNNFRFAAYRGLYLWLSRDDKPKSGSYREELPACLSK